jgi:hypothetical protein
MVAKEKPGDTMKSGATIYKLIYCFMEGNTLTVLPSVVSLKGASACQ